MKKPYTLIFNEDFIDLKDEKRDPPKWSKYNLIFATEKCHFKSQESEFFTQQVVQNPFHIDLLEFDVKKSLTLPFHIHERQLFMFFTLKGNLLYMTEANMPIVKTQSNTLMMAYYDEGSYYACLGKGKHIVIVINFSLDWIKEVTRDYYNIQSLLERLDHSKSRNFVMYQRTISKKIQRWLFEIYNYSFDNKGALDGNLRKYLSLLLEYYETTDKEDRDLAFEIKIFIESNYRNPELNLQFIANHFNRSERSLTNIFKRKYLNSIQKYYADFRVEKAIGLMNEENMEIKEVYLLVGYQEERTFRYALEKYKNSQK